MTAPEPISIELLSRVDCHLCEDARAVVDDVLASLPPLDRSRFVLSERDIDADPQLLAEFSEDVPVVRIDQAVHTFWRVDAVRFRAALERSLTATSH